MGWLIGYPVTLLLKVRIWKFSVDDSICVSEQRLNFSYGILERRAYDQAVYLWSQSHNKEKKMVHSQRSLFVLLQKQRGNNSFIFWDSFNHLFRTYCLQE
jgi:hypothetical protein